MRKYGFVVCLPKDLKMDRIEMHRVELTRADKWLRKLAVGGSGKDMLNEAQDIILSLMCVVQAEDLDSLMLKRKNGI
jgi:hypothetical protein